MFSKLLKKKLAWSMLIIIVCIFCTTAVLFIRHKSIRPADSNMSHKASSFLDKYNDFELYEIPEFHHPKPEEIVEETGSNIAIVQQSTEQAVQIRPNDLVFKGIMAAGDEGEDVLKLQQVLAEKGYLSDEPDGYYGPNTVSAVEAFQKDNGLEVDGSVGLKTINAINGNENASIQQLAKQINNDLGNDLYYAFLYSSQYPYSVHYMGGEERIIDPEACFLNFVSYHYGDCYCMASTFCILARDLGFNAYVIKGVVPTREGDFGEHSWVEIEEKDGTIRCFDPQFYYQMESGGFDFQYGDPGTWMYMDYERIY